MKKPWQIWLLFSLCLAAIGLAMTWLSATTLQLDALRETDRIETELARQEAELQERVSSALYRMDLMLLPLGDYRDVHPTDALLAIEVANSSLRKDRRIKRDLYAEAEIPEYWIVNLVDDVVEVHTDPKDGRYRSSRTRGPGTTISLVAFPDVELSVDDLLA